MISRHKLSFQLTPLLDLLLIVIFAQYMDVQQTARRAEQEIERRAGESTTSALAAQQRAEQRLAALEQQRQTVRGELERRLSNVTDEMQRLLMQREDLGDLVAQLFQIPQDILERILKQEERTPEEQAELRKLVADLAATHSNEAIKHLITHQAMQKRMDLWTLFITDEGAAQLKAGGRTFEFRFRDTLSQETAELKGLSTSEKREAIKRAETEAAELFARELFTAYKSVPQPKSLVVLLVSWKDADRHYRLPALEGINATLRLLQISGDRTQFVPAILGREIDSE